MGGRSGKLRCRRNVNKDSSSRSHPVFRAASEGVNFQAASDADEDAVSTGG